MDQYKVVVSPSSKWTRLLLTLGPDELVRAILPAPSLVRHERAASTLLEGLSMWVDRPLHVVLSAVDPDSGLRLGLADPFTGMGERTLYYQVEVIERAHRRRRGRRIGGIGDFGDLRQLRLVPDGEVR